MIKKGCRGELVALFGSGSEGYDAGETGWSSWALYGKLCLESTIGGGGMGMGDGRIGWRSLDNLREMGLFAPSS